MSIDTLLEKYLDTVKFHGSTVDFFVNPDSKDLRELDKEKGSMYRFIADFDEKLLYVVSAAKMIHDDMFNSLPQIKKITSWPKYVGDGSDRIFTGDCYKGFKNINSDTYRIAFIEGGRFKSRLENLKRLRDKDFSWLSKWMNPQEIIDIVDKAIEYQEGDK